MTEETRSSSDRDSIPGRRDAFIDVRRAFSLLVVVLWHWVFSIVHVGAGDRVHVTNVLQFTYALWFCSSGPPVTSSGSSTRPW